MIPKIGEKSKLFFENFLFFENCVDIHICGKYNSEKSLVLG